MATRPLRALAIDPGERVGWARGLLLPDSVQLEDHGIAGLKPFALKLGDAITNYDVLIYESYRLIKARSKDGDELQTSQLIGIIRYLAWINPDLKLVQQSPSIKKTADKTAEGDFKELIEAEPGKHDDAHDIDAIRHLWYYSWKLQMKVKADAQQT